MKRRPLVTILVILAILLLAEVIVFLYFFFRAPKPSTSIEPGSSNVHVGLFTIGDVVTWPLNSHIPLNIKADGNQPIRSIELYINGILYETRTSGNEIPSTKYNEIWTWQPGTTGQFILIAHATDILGFTGISQPLLLTATETTTSVTPIQAQAGESFESIARKNNLPLEELQKVNPGVDLSAAAAADDTLNIPNLPDPISNQKIIPGYSTPPAKDPTQPEATATPSQDSAGDLLAPVELIDLANLIDSGENDVTPSPINDQMDNFLFWFKQKVLPLVNGEKDQTTGETSGGEEPSSGEIHPPIEPVAAADFSKCDVTVHLKNAIVYVDSSDPLTIKNNEDGFFLYRSRDGGKFERIATLPKINGLTDIYSNLYENGYKDLNQFGIVSYYLSAFNSEGEVPGKPVTIPLNGSECSNANLSRFGFTKVSLQDGVLNLPFGMDLAYFYVQRQMTNNIWSRGWRVPEGNRTFLPKSGVKLDLYTYLETILDQIQSPDLNLLIQVWGWSGGQLVHAGNFKVSIHRSILLVCSVEGEGGCTGSGGGQWLPEINISNSKPVREQKYEVRWLASNMSPMKDVCFQVAAGPYPNEDFWQVNLPISSYCIDAKGNEGTFLLDLGITLYPEGPLSGGQWGVGSHLMDFESNWFQYNVKEGEPFTLYLRAYPRHQSSGFNRYANVAVMHYNTAPLPSEMPPLSSEFPSLYDVEILQDSYVPPTFETFENWGCVIVEEDPTGHYTPGQMVCPPPLNTQHDDCAGKNELVCLIEGLANSLGDLYDYVLMGWNGMKQFYAEQIAKIIPYCSQSDDCVFVIRKAIDYGIQYATGVPANPPQSEDLIADSIASYIVDSAKEGEQYFTGLDVSAIEAFCSTAVDCEKELSEFIKAELKKSRSLASQPACLYQYDAYFHNKGAMCLDPSIIVHPAPGGGNYPGLITVKITRKSTPESLASDPKNAGNYRISLVVTGKNTNYTPPLSGSLYQVNLTQIPWIDPGESFLISTSLTKCENCNFDALYFGSSAHMEAVEECYSPGSSWEWVPCLNGGKDTWDFTNPADKYSNQVGMP